MKKSEWLTLAEALLFIIGAALLVFNITSNTGVWFFIGLSLAIIAVVMWTTVFIIEKRKKAP